MAFFLILDHPWKLFLYDAPFVEAEPCPPVTMVTVSYGKSFRDSHAELLVIASA